ncbi:hypothetical protein EYF80_016284 [Liparis tanakae]|uniref:Uncharacterized protein n=1 Tax=Liparis tanakae TaxID=230148 RepID=A0A4Z2I823_9TELE|nr:hypothetical protein EYF80_016284 [Liparis tanakae]
MRGGAAEMANKPHIDRISDLSCDRGPSSTSRNVRDTKETVLLLEKLKCLDPDKTDIIRCLEWFHRTIRYKQTNMSPEVILGLPFTEAIDMWSLRSIMAEILEHDGLHIDPGPGKDVVSTNKVTAPVCHDRIDCALWSSDLASPLGLRPPLGLNLLDIVAAVPKKMGMKASHTMQVVYMVKPMGLASLNVSGTPRVLMA